MRENKRSILQLGTNIEYCVENMEMDYVTVLRLLFIR